MSLATTPAINRKKRVRSNNEDVQLDAKRLLAEDSVLRMEGDEHVAVRPPAPTSLADVGHLFDHIFAFLSPTDDFACAYSRLFLTMDRRIHLRLSCMTTFVSAPRTPTCTGRCTCAMIPSILGHGTTLRHLTLKMHGRGDRCRQAIVRAQPTNLLSLDMTRRFDVEPPLANGKRLIYGLTAVTIVMIPSMATLTTLKIVVMRNPKRNRPLDFSRFCNLTDLTIDMMTSRWSDEIYHDARWPPNVTALDAAYLNFSPLTQPTMPESLATLRCAVVQAEPRWSLRFPNLRVLALTDTRWMRFVGDKSADLPNTLTHLSAPLIDDKTGEQFESSAVFPPSLTVLRHVSPGAAGGVRPEAHCIALKKFLHRLNMPNLRRVENVYINMRACDDDPLVYSTAFERLADLRVLSVTDTVMNAAFISCLRLLTRLEEIVVRRQVPPRWAGPGDEEDEEDRQDHLPSGELVIVPCTPTLKRVSLVMNDDYVPDAHGRLPHTRATRGGVSDFLPPPHMTVALPHDSRDMARLEFLGLYGFQTVTLIGYNTAAGRPLRGLLTCPDSNSSNARVAVVSTTNVCDAACRSLHLDACPASAFEIVPIADSPERFHLSMRTAQITRERV